MSKLSDKFKEAKKKQEFIEKAKETQKKLEKLEAFKQNGITITEESESVKEQPRLKEKAQELTKLTIDEIRAQYIFVCKKKPKHDSKQTKAFLIEEIIKTLRFSIIK